MKVTFSVFRKKIPFWTIWGGKPLILALFGPKMVIFSYFSKSSHRMLLIFAIETNLQKKIAMPLFKTKKPYVHLCDQNFGVKSVKNSDMHNLLVQNMRQSTKQ